MCVPQCLCEGQRIMVMNCSLLPPGDKLMSPGSATSLAHPRYYLLGGALLEHIKTTRLEDWKYSWVVEYLRSTCEAWVQSYKSQTSKQKPRVQKGVDCYGCQSHLDLKLGLGCSPSEEQQLQPLKSKYRAERGKK